MKLYQVVTSSGYYYVYADRMRISTVETWNCEVAEAGLHFYRGDKKVAHFGDYQGWIDLGEQDGITVTYQPGKSFWWNPVQREDI